MKEITSKRNNQGRSKLEKINSNLDEEKDIKEQTKQENTTNIDIEYKDENASEKNIPEILKNVDEPSKTRKLSRSSTWDASGPNDVIDSIDREKLVRYSSCDESLKDDKSDILFSRKITKYTSYENHQPKPKVIIPGSPINKISTYEEIKIGDLPKLYSKERSILEKKLNDNRLMDIYNENEKSESGSSEEKPLENSEISLSHKHSQMDSIDINEAIMMEKERVHSASSESSSNSVVPPIGKSNVVNMIVGIARNSFILG